MHTLILLMSLSFACVVEASAADVSGSWMGVTQCPLGQLTVNVDIKGKTGTFRESYSAGNPAPVSIPVSVRFKTGHQGIWVYFETGNDWHDGLLSGDGSSIRMDGMGDCRDYYLRRTRSPTDQASTGKGSAAPSKGVSASGIEPTEAEMRAAVERDLSGQGNASGAPGELRVQNPAGGMSVEIQDFEKLECSPAQGRGRAGYDCRYLVTVRSQMYSPGGSAAGNEHADAVNKLMDVLTGGKIASNSKGRFVKATGRWVVIHD